nr:DUF262 domain-containing protein [Odoribacter splanchnicus]
MELFARTDKIKIPDENSFSELDVEEEDLKGEEEVIMEPFDPTQIDVDIANVNLGSLIDQLINDEIDLQPDFQRASDIWDPVQKSRLIESILLGLPLPSFYFSENPVSKKLAIIDGLQRLCALRDFILNKESPLVLRNLQFLKDFEGKTYADLARPEIRRINALKITINTLRKNTPDKVKFVIFQRVNTAGVPLEAQEMRHALNQGEAARFIKELADLDSFKRATNYCVRSKRMQDRDFVNRFIAFYIGYEEYNGELDMFLNDKMRVLNKMKAGERDELKEAFEKSMDCCYRIFGEDAFRRRKRPSDRRKPISKSVFDTVSVNIAWLTDAERMKLEERAGVFKQKMMELFNDNKFDFSISTGTAQKYNVEQRFNRVKQIIGETLSYD